MLTTVTTMLMRVVSGFFRRADATLAKQAARNAAGEMAHRDAGRLDVARTLRDLRRLQPAPG